MNLRIKKRKVTYAELNEGVDLHMDFDIDSNLNFRKRSNKDKLIDLCNTLDIKEKIIEIPAKGYSAIPLLDVNNRAYARSKRIIVRMIKEISMLICPSNPSLVIDMVKKRDNVEENLSNLKKSSTELILFGNRNVRIITQCILAQSFRQSYIEEFLQNEAIRFENNPQYDSCKKKILMGKVCFASSRKIYQTLKIGNEIPKHNYAYRIPALKLSKIWHFYKRVSL